MLAAATQAASSFFKVSAISQNYIYASNNTPAIPSFSSTSVTRTGSPAPPQSNSPPFTSGLWRVQEAVHKTNGKRVSVWSFDKKNSSLDRLTANARDRVLEVLKAEATALTRMRHPCVLEVVEPLEETRSEMVFATEPIIGSLAMSIPGSAIASRDSEPLDEIEIQKGVLQLTKGLAFLHTSARLGDWKISGLGLIIPLLGLDGSPTKWEFLSYDVRIPPSSQRSFDYMAPEYALQEQIVTSSDMYSLGCVIYAVHAKGVPPFRNHNSLSSMRSNQGRLEGGGGLPGMESWDVDLRNLISSLVTPSPMARLSTETIALHAWFSGVAVSTLNFLDPATFAPKPREEKIAFMKGLQTVLPRFSEGMRKRKILPSILAEMKDPLLLPSILPNVFNISTALDANQFQEIVLPSLKPLFTVKDPPQNMIVLLENLSELQRKTAKNVFRADVLPLVYYALESEHPQVQERALQCVPDLCETIDFAEVQSVLFTRVAYVFTKTKILSVKVSSLQSFLALVKTLDQASLTQKLVPLLAKIRTKGLATLAVHEEMGKKIDREAVALQLLPQLWQMSVGPLLNVEQFGRFMSVIRNLSERVEHEHLQHLRDSQRIEDRSAVPVNGVTSSIAASGPVDFETLISSGAKTGASRTSQSLPPKGENGDSWEDDVWGSMLNSDLGARSFGASSLTSSPLSNTSTLTSFPFPTPPSTTSTSSLSAQQPPLAHAALPPPLAPRPPLSNPMQPSTVSSKPNYNIALEPAQSITSFSQPPNLPQSSFFASPLQPIQPMQPNYMSSPAPLPASKPTSSPTTSMTPLVPTRVTNTQQAKSSPDWSGFDPLS
ncbi:kinase-like domain-containing protein [Cantharellus anzutake]|uniref:kinase-like domain-containing protein n=1 Tax=Cantharellus anzutake TaxID=1750568 RepID=UPI0019037098|nr:kinase-like domain-containing protein [Cantharellus anzutake]KAF8337568.1 kinase-like domain-containing protein [Cantharellus anzutake]